jgi:hypothetical protein
VFAREGRRAFILSRNGLDANSNVKCEITVFSDPLKERLSLAVRVSPLPSLFPEQTASMAENNSGAAESAGAPDSGRFETFSQIIPHVVRAGLSLAGLPGGKRVRWSSFTETPNAFGADGNSLSQVRSEARTVLQKRGIFLLDSMP